VPSFSSTAARITEPWVGAWVWASGSQVWNGNIGTLMAKPRNMPPKTRSWVPWAMAPVPLGSNVMSKVWPTPGTSARKYSARKLTSMNAEPNAV
jgi:hypothetical protein